MALRRLLAAIVLFASLTGATALHGAVSLAERVGGPGTFSLRPHGALEPVAGLAASFACVLALLYLFAAAGNQRCDAVVSLARRISEVNASALGAGFLAGTLVVFALMESIEQVGASGRVGGFESIFGAVPPLTLLVGAALAAAAATTVRAVAAWIAHAHVDVVRWIAIVCRGAAGAALPSWRNVRLRRARVRSAGALFIRRAPKRGPPVPAVR